MSPSTAHCRRRHTPPTTIATHHWPQQLLRTIGHNSYCASSATNSHCAPSVGARLPRVATPEAHTHHDPVLRLGPGLIPLASVVNGLQGLIRATCRGTTDVLNHDYHGDFWHFVPGAVWLRCVQCSSGAVVCDVAWPCVTWFGEGLSHLAQNDPEGVRQLEGAEVEGR